MDQEMTVLYSVRQGNEEPVLWAYHLKSGELEGPITTWEGPRFMRFNQSADVCNQAYAIAPLTVDCAIDQDFTLTLEIRDETRNGEFVLEKTIDPQALGLRSLADGYAWPIAIAQDKSTIYLGQRVETESYVAGLWKLDVATGVVSEVSYVREKNLYQYEINPVTKQLIGVTFVPPEGLGEPPNGPSKIFLVDLTTGVGRVLEDRSRRVFENVFLSEDGTLFSAHVYLLPTEASEVPETAVIRVEDAEHLAEFDGVVKDWFNDTLVFDRGGNLFLFDLKTQTETRLTFETDASVEYVGVVK